jgi:hypothetical protein
MNSTTTKQATPREAVLAFAAWLTTRPVITKFGGDEECGIIAELVDMFCTFQGWNEITDEGQQAIKPYPSEVKVQDYFNRRHGKD